jgi:ribosomal protein L24E
LADKGGSDPNILRYKYKEEGSVEEGRYCAEARHPRRVKWTVESAEKYLSEVQTLPAEGGNQ